MARCAVVHFRENLVMLHLVGEVAAVELDLQDGLIQILKLREGKYLR